MPIKVAQDVTSQRLYLETMEEILKSANKIIIDKPAEGQSGVLPYLPLPDLLHGPPPAGAGTGEQRDPAQPAMPADRRAVAAAEGGGDEPAILAIVGVVLVVGGILPMSSFFIVDQTEQALVLQLGEVRRVIREPGLKVKRPFIENVVVLRQAACSISSRRRRRSSSPTRSGWWSTPTPATRITNPLQFYQTVGNEAGMRARLNALVSGSLRRVLGSVTLNDILSEKRAAIMRQIRDDVGAEAKPFGIERRRCAAAPRRSAGREQPGDLRPHAIGARAAGARNTAARAPRRRRTCAPMPSASAP